MNIYEKMSAITTEVAAVAKNLTVETGKGKYKAVSEADVLAAVKPVEAKHGVYSFPVQRNIIDAGEIVSKYKDTERKQLYMRVETVYRFVNAENPEEYVDITTYGDGLDGGDKAPGKAMTYADKYALLKAYKITTGEDPDKEASGELQDKTSAMIGETEKAVLKEMCAKRGLDVAATFPKGLDMTGAKYIECVKRLAEIAEK